MPNNLFKGRCFLEDYTEVVTALSKTNPLAAGAFCDAVEHAIELVMTYPEAGSKAGFRHAPQVRRWVLRPFPNYLLFYESRAEGILLIRLLHGARELAPLIPPG